MKRLRRYDRCDLTASQTTPEGFLLAEGFAARPGVYEYRRADGTIRRELVPEEELHKPGSLASLARKPVTFQHPGRRDGGIVTPDNVGRLGVGDLDGDVEVVYDSGFVRVKVAVRRADAITAIKRGVVELSPGYTIDLDETPGEHPKYGRYDAIQRNREYNHLALVYKARGGTNMRLRADGHQSTGAPNMIRLLTLLGLTNIRADADDDTHALQAIEGAVTKVIEERDALQARVDALPTGEQIEAARLEWHNDRTAILQAAEVHGVKLDSVDKASNDDLRKAVVLGARPSLRTDGDPAYYAVAFDMLEPPQARTDAFDAFGTGFGNSGPSGGQLPPMPVHNG